MQEQLISFQTAKLAQENGFPKTFFNTAWYNELGTLLGRTDLNKNGQTFSEAYPDEPSFYGNAIKEEHKKEFSLKFYKAPTQSLLQKWLREVHNINIKIDDFIDDETGIEWDFEIVLIGTDLDEKGNYVPLISYCMDNNPLRKFKTYEEALEEGLYQALKLIKL